MFFILKSEFTRKVLVYFLRHATVSVYLLQIYSHIAAFCCLFVFETGSRYVLLADIELSVETGLVRLAS